MLDPNTISEARLKRGLTCPRLSSESRRLARTARTTPCGSCGGCDSTFMVGPYAILLYDLTTEYSAGEVDLVMVKANARGCGLRGRARATAADDPRAPRPGTRCRSGIPRCTCISSRRSTTGRRATSWPTWSGRSSGWISMPTAAVPSRPSSGITTSSTASLTASEPETATSVLRCGGRRSTAD